MSGTSLKGALRAARECLGNKNYKAALDHCRLALKQDPRSYDACVYAGKATFFLKEYEPSRRAYEKAAEIDASSLPAWQGLAELFGENGTDDAESLARVCENVVRICDDKGDVDRSLEYHKRMAIALAASDQTEKSKLSWEELIRKSESKPQIYFEALCNLADLMLSEKENTIQQGLKDRIAKEKTDVKNSLALLNLPEEELKAKRKERISSIDSDSILRSVEEDWCLQNDGSKLENVLLKIIDTSLTNSFSSLPYDQQFLHIQCLKLRAFENDEESRKAVLMDIVWFGKKILDSGKVVNSEVFEMLMLWLEDDYMDEILSLHFSESFVNYLKWSQKIDRSSYREILYIYIGLKNNHSFPSNPLSFISSALYFHRLSDGNLLIDKKRKLCERGLRVHQDSLTGWFILAETHAQDENFKFARECIRRGLTAVDNLKIQRKLKCKKIEFKFKLLQCDLFLKLHEFDSANTMYEQIIEECKNEQCLQEILLSALKGYVMAQRVQNNHDLALKGIEELLKFDPSNHWAFSERGSIHLMRGNLRPAIQDFRLALKLFPDWSYHLKLGKAYWSAGGEIREKFSNVEFLEAARKNPSAFESFHWLGRFFLEVERNVPSAQKCFRKAVSLNPNDSESGIALCGIFEETQQLSLQLSLCREISEKSHDAFWAFKRLGLLLVENNKWDEAIPKLQHFLKSNSKDSDSWEALALSYQRLGRFSAALKAYEKSLSLQDGHGKFFSYLQLGNINLQLKSFAQAEENFRYAFSIAEDHSSVLWGLSSSLFGKAMDLLSSSAYSYAASLLNEAKVHAFKCTKLNGTFYSCWKLLGDILFLLSKFFPCSNSLDIEEWKNKKIKFSQKSSKAFLHSLHLNPNLASLHADVALSLFNQIEVKKSTEGHRVSKLSNEQPLLKKSVDPTHKLAQKMVMAALKLDFNDFHLWNVLGTVSYSPSLQQHCFIRALQIFPSSAISWLNLSLLYLKYGEEKLALKCLEQSRSHNPENSRIWAAMAAIFSNPVSGNPTKRDLDHAYANCLYALQFNPYPKLQLQLGVLAEKTNKLNNHQVYSALQNCSALLPKNISAQNLFSLSSESCKQFSQSVISLKNAILLTNSDKDDEDGNFRAQCILRLNLGRVYYKAGLVNTSALEFQDIISKDKFKTFQDNFSFWFIYALSTMNSSKLKESNKHSPTAQEICSKVNQLCTPFSKQYFLSIRLSLTIFVLVENYTGALEYFLSLPEECKNDPNICLMVLAISLLSKNFDLFLKLLPTCNSAFKFWTAEQAHHLMVIYHKLKGNTRAALSYVLHAIHLHPSSILLRSDTSNLFLSFSLPSPALRCLESIQNFTVEPNETSLLVKSTLCKEDALLACDFCTTTIDVVDRKSFNVIDNSYSCENRHSSPFLKTMKSLSSVQRLIHLFPSNPKARITLLLRGFQISKSKNYSFEFHKSLHRFSSILYSPYFSFQLSPFSLALTHLSTSLASLLSFPHQQSSFFSHSAQLALDHARKSIEVIRSHGIASLSSYAFCHLARCLFALGKNEVAMKSLGHINHDDMIACLNEVLLLLSKKDYHRALSSLASCEQRLLEDKWNKNEKSKEKWKAIVRVFSAVCNVHLGDLLAAELSLSDMLESTRSSDGQILSVAYYLHGYICARLYNSGKKYMLSKASHSLSNAISRSTLNSNGQLANANLLLGEIQAISMKDHSEKRKVLKESVIKELECWNTSVSEPKPHHLVFQISQNTHLDGPSSGEPSNGDSQKSKCVRRAIHLNPSVHSYWTQLQG